MFSRVVARHLINPKRLFSTNISHQADFTHAVVGAGAVGLAIARQLQGRDGSSTVLIEKHGSVGTETSSRNSEVVASAPILYVLTYSIRSYMLAFTTVKLH
jgi:L-2-hydroxyglutarate oxidase LhgO